MRVYDEVGSTNAVASGAEGGQPAGPWTLILADHQSSGRGRLRRSWESPRGSSVLLSAVVPIPASAGSDLGWVPLAVGCALVDALRATSGLHVGLKWPNDVLVAGPDGGKIAGILCEVGPGVVIAGVGLNVHQSRDELPVPAATSMAAGGQVVEREALVVAICDALVRHVPRVVDPAGSGLHVDYLETCVSLGRRVVITETNGARHTGVVDTVDEHGRLVVATTDGVRTFAAGDVEHATATSTGPGS